MACLAPALLVSWFAASAASATPAVPADVSCRTCHVSDKPTKKDAKLVRCPRAAMKGPHSLEQAPAELKLGTPGSAYGPVRFTHKAHARMADMGDGCAACHHDNEGRPIQRCGDCHAERGGSADAKAIGGVDLPDLRAARHRLCIECHRQFDRDGGCASCHDQEKARQARIGGLAKLPRRVVFRTRAEAGPVVTFPHEDHARRYGLQCAGCHRGLSCGACHGPEQPARRASLAKRSAGPVSMEAAHKACKSCHDADGCDKCHAGGKFGKLAADCETCHKGWQRSFDHRQLEPQNFRRSAELRKTMVAILANKNEKT